MAYPFPFCKNHFIHEYKSHLLSHKFCHFASLYGRVGVFMFCSMCINHFRHKGPRLEARPWSMAAFYKFKAAVSDLFFSLSGRAARKEARLCKIRRCRDLKERPRNTGEFCTGGGFFPLLRFLSFPGKKGNEERQEFCGKSPRVIL